MSDLRHRLRGALLGLRRDRQTGHLYYPVGQVRHFVRFPHEVVRARYRRHWFEKVYFNHYRPSGSDCVVDVGAGLGTEIIPLAASAPNLRYVAVEIQPWVYECLCLTLAQLPAGFVPFGSAIGEGEVMRLQPSRTGDEVSAVSGEGAVQVPVVRWDDFARRHAVETVDLLKVNIEGGEGELLDHVDLTRVKRIIVATHDFRADRGEGEAFRTSRRVQDRLASAKFHTTPLEHGWIYAERR